MKQQYGSLSRTITALSLAVGLSFGGAAGLGAQSTDTRDDSTAFLYQGTTTDFASATMVSKIDDLDDQSDDADDIDDDADDLDDINDDANDDLQDDVDDMDDVNEVDDDMDDDVYEGDDDLDDVNEVDDLDDDVYEGDDDLDDVNEVDDLDDDVYESDDDLDDVNEVNDDMDDDVYESDDDWDDANDVDDEYDDDAYESDDDDDEGDDDWDDFLGKPLNLQATVTDHWEVLGNGQAQPSGLMASEDELDDDLNLTVQTLVDGDYMIVVHANGSTDSPVIAAGDIEGEVQDGSILIELDEVEASGFEGRAHLEPEDADDINEIEVTIGVYPAGSVTPLSEPLQTPRG